MRQRGDPLFKEVLDRVRFGGCEVFVTRDENELLTHLIAGAPLWT